MASLEVSYHRTVNLGQYNSVMLGGKIVSDNSLAGYATTQEALKHEVDAIADRIADEAKLARGAK